MAHLARAKRLTAPVQAALAKNLLHERKGYSLLDSASLGCSKYCTLD